MMESLLNQTVTDVTSAMALDISIDYSNDPFYTEIWFWALIALLLLVILILLIRGGSKTKKSANKEPALPHLQEQSAE